MTIAEFIRDIRKSNQRPVDGGSSFEETILSITDIWSNEACAGYLLRAAKLSGLGEEETKKLFHSLHESFDELSVDEAKEYYCCHKI